MGLVICLQSKRPPQAVGVANGIRIKRAYEPRGEGEGYRVLIDRLWPRGISKEKLAPDAWMKELAPSDELRKWFGHDPSRFTEFQTRYREELKSEEARAALRELVSRAKTGTVTLLYGAKDEEHNNAVVLRSLVNQRLRRAAQPRIPSFREREGKRAGARGKEAAAPVKKPRRRRT